MLYALVAVLALIVFCVSFMITRAVALNAPLPKAGEPTAPEGDAGAIAKRLSGAIGYKTIAYAEQEKIDGSKFLALHEYLKANYPRVSSELGWETVEDYSLLLTWKGRGGAKPLALLAHMDVVPVSPGTEGDWKHEAYSGTIDGGYVWGRGTMDMKGHLVCVLEAVESLLAEGFRPESDVYLCFGHNEEIVCAPVSGAVAMAKLLLERGVRLDSVIDEGGVVMQGEKLLGMPGLLAMVGTAEKGYMDVSLSCSQEGGHSSQPPKNTALGILAAAVTKLEARAFKPRLTGTVEAMFTEAGRAMGFSKRLVFSNLWLFRPLLLNMLTKKPLTNAFVRTTLAATMASGSPAANVLPQQAEVVANMRILPGENMEDTLQRVREIVGDAMVTVSLMRGKDPSAESPVATESYNLIKGTLEGMYPGVRVLPYLMVGGTDSCHYEPVCDNIYRIAPFLVTDEELKTTHGTNERISLYNLLRGREFFRRIIIDYPSSAIEPDK